MPSIVHTLSRLWTPAACIVYGYNHTTHEETAPPRGSMCWPRPDPVQSDSEAIPKLLTKLVSWPLFSFFWDGGRELILLEALTQALWFRGRFPKNGVQCSFFHSLIVRTKDWRAVLWDQCRASLLLEQKQKEVREKGVACTELAVVWESPVCVQNFQHVKTCRFGCLLELELHFKDALKPLDTHFTCPLWNRENEEYGQTWKVIQKGLCA